MHAEHVVKAVLLGFQYDVVATFYCLDIMSGQSEFWLDKCGKWPEIGQWPAAISSSDMYVCMYRISLNNGPGVYYLYSLPAPGVKLRQAFI